MGGKSPTASNLELKAVKHLKLFSQADEDLGTWKGSGRTLGLKSPSPSAAMLQQQPNSLSKVPPFVAKKSMPNATTFKKQGAKGKEYRPIFVQEFPVKMNDIIDMHSRSP